MNDNKNKYIVKTIFPHYLIPRQMWEERLKTIVYAGYNCIELFFLWNVHETSFGVWNFTGENCIETILKLATKYKLSVVAHPGSFVNLEWDGSSIPPYVLVETDGSVRSVNNAFLNYVSGWYNRIMPFIKKYEKGNKNGCVTSVEIETLEGELAQLNRNAISEILTKFNLQIPFTIKIAKYNNDIMKTNTVSNIKQMLAQGLKTLNGGFNVGGFSFGFNNSIKELNGFGAFLSSAYGGDALISPFGEINEKEIQNMRILTSFIKTFEDSLFLGTPVNASVFVNGNLANTIEINMYALVGGGAVLALMNNGNDKATFRLNEKLFEFPKKAKITLSPFECKFILRNVPLSQFGANVKINYCTGEILFCRKRDAILYIAVCVEREAEISISGEEPASVSSGIFCKMEANDNTATAVFTDESHGTIRFGKTKIRIIGLDKKTASEINNIDDKGQMRCATTRECSEFSEISAHEMQIFVSTVQFQLKYNEVFDNMPLSMEANRIYSGFAMYQAEYSFPETIIDRNLLGIVVMRPSDVISIYFNDEYIATRAPFGKNIFIERPIYCEQHNVLRVKNEIWGHAYRNFDSFPSLQLSAKKGIRGLGLVVSKKKIDSKITIRLENKGHYGILLEKYANIYVNGNMVRYIGGSSDYKRYVEITPYIRSKFDNEIEVIALNEDDKLGDIYFIECLKPYNYSIAEINIDITSVCCNRTEMLKTILPYEMKRGNDRFFTFILASNLFSSDISYKAVVSGSGIKVTAFFNDNIVGRLWLADAENRENTPLIDGIPDTLYLPSSMFIKSENTLVLYVEAVTDSENAKLENVVFITIQ